jgi:hypothetical protein
VSQHNPVGRRELEPDEEARMTDRADSEPNDETPAAGPESSGMLEIAANGRAKCRACGTALEKGKPRCGEKTANPFGEGTTVYWFHLRCAAERRPQTFLQGLINNELPSESLAEEETSMLRAIAEFGALHPRAARLTKAGVAPSGRARCRGCKELIEKDGLRLELSMFNEGRFDPVGYLHVRCLTQYVEAKVPWSRLEHICQALPEQQRQLVASECA